MDHFVRVGDYVQVAQSQDVDFQQSEFFNGVHFILRHDWRMLRLLARFGFALNRQILGEFFLSNHHGSSVNADTALQALKSARRFDDRFDVGIALIECPQVARGAKTVFVLIVLFEAIFERRIATHHHWWHQLGNLVAQAVGIIQNPCRISHGVARLDRAKSNDLCNVVSTILFGCVTNHFVAVSRVKIHVDVWH